MKALILDEKKDVIKWRKIFSVFMLFFLPIQYIVIVILLVLQGFNIQSFQLDSHIFHILIIGTLAESYFLIQIIFKYMFLYKNN